MYLHRATSHSWPDCNAPPSLYRATSLRVPCSVLVLTVRNGLRYDRRWSLLAREARLGSNEKLGGKDCHTDLTVAAGHEVVSLKWPCHALEVARVTRLILPFVLDELGMSDDIITLWLGKGHCTQPYRIGDFIPHAKHQFTFSCEEVGWTKKADKVENYTCSDRNFSDLTIIAINQGKRYLSWTLYFW